MVSVTRRPIIHWLAPAFLLALAGVFLLAPFGLKDKLDAICFGI